MPFMARDIYDAPCTLKNHVVAAASCADLNIRRKSMKQETRLTGYSVDDLAKSIWRTISVGLEDQPQRILHVKSPRKALKNIRKALNGTQDWSVKGTVVHNGGGKYVNGIASWGRQIRVQTYGRTFAFRIFQLDQSDGRLVYSIPLDRPTPLKKLPELCASVDDVRLYFDMADATAITTNDEPLTILMKHPLKETVKTQARPWAAVKLKSSELEALFTACPTLISVVAAAVDIQLRAIRNLADVPLGLYNMVCSPKNELAEPWLWSVLQSVTFTTSPQGGILGPILISDTGESAITAWKKCWGRLTVMRTSSSTANLMADALQEHRRQLKCHWSAQPPFVIPPMTFTASVLCRPEALDIVIDSSSPPLTPDQQDLLRAAVSTLVANQSFAKEVVAQWCKIMAHPTAYRLDGFAIWQKKIAAGLFTRWFPDRPELMRFFNETNQRTEDAANKRHSSLHAAFSALVDIDGYADQICEKPQTVTEAKTVLSDRAFAFWFTPKKGRNRDVRMLVFSTESLTRFLKQKGGCDSSLYPAFLDECERVEILCSKNDSITLGGATFNGVSFYRNKLEMMKN